MRREVVPSCTSRALRDLEAAPAVEGDRGVVARPHDHPRRGAAAPGRLGQKRLHESSTRPLSSALVRHGEREQLGLGRRRGRRAGRLLRAVAQRLDDARQRTHQLRSRGHRRHEPVVPQELAVELPHREGTGHEAAQARPAALGHRRLGDEEEAVWRLDDTGIEMPEEARTERGQEALMDRSDMQSGNHVHVGAGGLPHVAASRRHVVILHLRPSAPTSAAKRLTIASPA